MRCATKFLEHGSLQKIGEQKLTLGRLVKLQCDIKGTRRFIEALFLRIRCTRGPFIVGKYIGYWAKAQQ